MKLKNNKGFAVSTLLYGLSIMGFLIVILLMSMMSSNRINTTNFVKQIEDDLNRYSLTEATIRATDEVSGTQEYYVPYGQAGWYKIELWGASGAAKNGHLGGRGAYTSGLIYLEENTHLYFYVGTSGTASSGGSNNGGKSSSTVAGGGGATDVRVQSGSYTEDNSMKSRIMVAGGGGGASNTADGGKGGDLRGYKGNGTVGSANQLCTSFTASDGSGGGYCNGAVSEGGSSYISGYAGGSSWNLIKDTTDFSMNFNQNKTAVSLKYAFVEYDEEGNPNGYREPQKGFSFVNGIMIPGVNEGDGKAKIERVNLISQDQVLAKKTGLDNIRKIVDCVDNASGTWAEIQAITNKNDTIGAVNIVPTSTSSVTVSPDTANKNLATDGNLDTSVNVTVNVQTKCLTVTFNANYNLDEIAVWHKVGNIAKHSLKACHSTDDSSCITLSEYDGTDNDPIIETANGLHYSAYSLNSSASLTDGVYYIVPVSNPAVVLKTGNAVLGQDMTVVGGTIDGTNYQKWQVTKEPSNVYVLLEAQNYNSMQINGAGTGAGDSIIGGQRLTGSNRERWIITPTKNGMYTISSPLGTKAIFEGNYFKTANNTTSGLKTKFYFINSDY